MRYILLWLVFIPFTVFSQNLLFDAIIAADGTGDYTSISDAISRTRKSITSRYLFYIQPGTYNEKLFIATDNLSLIGSQEGEVLITWGDFSGDSQGHTTSTSYTALIDGDGFYAENITFENSAGNVGQAVAVSATGLQQTFKNCRFLGFQDTYYAKTGIQYFSNCYIEGATDFIFGESTAVFDNCQINCVKGGQYITAPADTKLITQVSGQSFYHGLLFLECDITANGDVPASSYFLGRPWQPNSSSVYVDCTLGSHIKPAGWSEWSNTNHLSATFAEYQSKDANGNLVDVSSRVSWSQQLTSEQTNVYRDKSYYLNGWDLSPISKVMEVPSNLMAIVDDYDSATLSWDAIGGSLGYVLFRDDSVHAIITENSYTELLTEKEQSYQVATLSEFGNLGEKSISLVVEKHEEVLPVLNIEPNIKYHLTRGSIQTSEEVNFSIYTLNGKIVRQKLNNTRLPLNDLTTGIYIIRMTNKLGVNELIKVAL